jgi:hypothetical protein
VSRTHSPSPTHRSSTRGDATRDGDAGRADRPRRLPGLPTQAAIVTAVPLLLLAATHPALVATAVGSAAVTAVAVALAQKRRRTHQPTPLAE